MKSNIRIHFLKILNMVTLFIFSVLVFTSVFDFAEYQVYWPVTILQITTIAKIVLMLIALCKIFYFFEEDRVNALIGLGLLSFFVLLFLLKQCDYIQLILLVVSMLGIRVDKILKTYISVELVLIVVTIILALVGVIPNYHKHADSRAVSDFYSLGFTNHNPPMALWLFFLLSLFCLISELKKKIKVIIVTISMFFTVIMYFLTASNTSFIIGITCSIVFLVVSLLQVENNGVALKYKKLIKIMILSPVYSVLVTIIGIVFYGRFGRKGLPFSTLLHRYEIIYWDLKLSGLPMLFSTLREAYIGDVDFSYFLSSDLHSGMYDNVKFNLFSGLGTLTRGQLFGGSDIEYFNILLFDGLMVLVPYIILSIYLLYRAYKSNNYFLMFCITCSIFYGNFEALKSGYTVFQVFIVLFLADLRNDKFKSTQYI